MLGAGMGCEKREKKKDSSCLKTTVEAGRNPSSQEGKVKTHAKSNARVLKRQTQHCDALPFKKS